jgi:hypothetical protein
MNTSVPLICPSGSGENKSTFFRKEKNATESKINSNEKWNAIIKRR